MIVLVALLTQFQEEKIELDVALEVLDVISILA